MLWAVANDSLVTINKFWFLLNPQINLSPFFSACLLDEIKYIKYSWLSVTRLNSASLCKNG